VAPKALLHIAVSVICVPPGVFCETTPIAASIALIPAWSLARTSKISIVRHNIGALATVDNTDAQRCSQVTVPLSAAFSAPEVGQLKDGIASVLWLDPGMGGETPRTSTRYCPGSPPKKTTAAIAPSPGSQHNSCIRTLLPPPTSAYRLENRSLSLLQTNVTLW